VTFSSTVSLKHQRDKTKSTNLKYIAQCQIFEKNHKVGLHQLYREEIINETMENAL